MRGDRLFCVDSPNHKHIHSYLLYSHKLVHIQWYLLRIHQYLHEREFKIAYCLYEMNMNKIYVIPTSSSKVVLNQNKQFFFSEQWFQLVHATNWYPHTVLKSYVILNAWLRLHFAPLVQESPGMKLNFMQMTPASKTDKLKPCSDIKQGRLAFVRSNMRSDINQKYTRYGDGIMMTIIMPLF